MSDVTDGGKDGWDLVASRVAREMHERGVNANEIYVAVKLDPKTLQRALDGRPIRREPQKRLAAFFGWPDHGVAMIRQGLDPSASVPDGYDVELRLNDLERRAERTEEILDRLLRHAGLEP